MYSFFYLRNNGNEDGCNLIYFLAQPFEAFCRDNLCFDQQLKPISGFVCFL